MQDWFCTALHSFPNALARSWSQFLIVYPQNSSCLCQIRSGESHLSSPLGLFLLGFLREEALTQLGTGKCTGGNTLIQNPQKNFRKEKKKKGGKRFSFSLFLLIYRPCCFQYKTKGGQKRSKKPLEVGRHQISHYFYACELFPWIRIFLFCFGHNLS